MKVFSHYFEKNRVVSPPDFTPHLPVIIVIPIFDDPEIITTLDSLRRCVLPVGGAGVILVVNHSEKCPEEIKQKNIYLATRLKEELLNHPTPGINFKLTEAYDLPAKFAGVGFARKIGMDEAAWYFYQDGNPDGVIASLDADTLVKENYVTALASHFERTKIAGTSIRYEHRLCGTEEAQKNAIQKYELYLHYYCQSLRYTGHPYAYHCIGSAFAVRASDYAAQGGMNKRQAGEDFYFIQKLITTGRYDTLTTTTVYPSARISLRTPFGTGMAIKQIIKDEGKFYTYNIKAFQGLKSFFDGLSCLYKADQEQTEKYLARQEEPLRTYLSGYGLTDIVKEINANTASAAVFQKRFYDNFNAFRVLKYLNFAHTSYFEKQEIIEAAQELLKIQGRELPDSPEGLLDSIRKM